MFPNGKPLPSFIGGSDLAVTAESPVAEPAKDWIRMVTSTGSEQTLADKGTLPNNLTQLEPPKTSPPRPPPTPCRMPGSPCRRPAGVRSRSRTCWSTC